MDMKCYPTEWLIERQQQLRAYFTHLPSSDSFEESSPHAGHIILSYTNTNTNTNSLSCLSNANDFKISTEI